MLQAGSLVDGKYEIIKKIGQGGMSIVWLALYERLTRLVAIKEIQKAKTKQNKITEVVIRREADLLKNLAHPGLPMLFDVIDTEDAFLMVMTYVEGETLSQLLQRQGAQPQELVIDWGRQLCEILEYLHSRPQPILYADMKPGNIILQADGKLKLIDFGIACEFETEKALSVGTRGYAAPEQYSAGNQLDIRADIYSLGVTLHQLVTGKDPAEHPGILHPIRQYDPSLSSDMERIIRKCTQADPNQRFQSISELQYALNANDKGMARRWISSAYRYVRRNSGKFLNKVTQLWFWIINTRKFPDTQNTKEINKAENESGIIVSCITEELNTIYYNAELLMSLQSDDEDAEI